jgi:uncharacterized membrane protein YccC
MFETQVTMDVQLRAAGRMALILFLSAIINASKIGHGGWAPVLLVFSALIVFAFLHPRKFFRDLE